MAPDTQPLHKKSRNSPRATYLPQEPPPAKKKCSSYHVFKILSIIYAILFILIGVLLTGLAVWIIIIRQDYGSLTDIILGPLLLLLIAGGIILLTALIGCIGASCDKLWPLRIFLAIIILVFIIQVVVGILAYVYREETIEKFGERIQFAITDYTERDDIKSAVDKAQRYWKCCGIENPDDWKRNKQLCPTPGSCSVPDSCCRTETKDCGETAYNTANLKDKGCKKSFKNWVERNLDIIGATALAMAIIHILGIFVVYLFLTKVEDRVRLFKYRKRFYS